MVISFLAQDSDLFPEIWSYLDLMRWLRVASPEPMSGKASEIKLPQGNSSGIGLKTIISGFVEKDRSSRDFSWPWKQLETSPHKCLCSGKSWNVDGRRIQSIYSRNIFWMLLSRHLLFKVPLIQQWTKNTNILAFMELVV